MSTEENRLNSFKCINLKVTYQYKKMLLVIFKSQVFKKEQDIFKGY